MAHEVLTETAKSVDYRREPAAREIAPLRTRQNFEFLSDVGGTLAFDLSILPGEGTTVLSRIRIAVTEPCQSQREHLTLLSVGEVWSETLRVTDCVEASVEVNLRLARPVRISVVAGGFAQGSEERVRGYIEVEEEDTFAAGPRVIAAPSSANVNVLALLRSLSGGTQDALDSVFQETYQLVRFAYEEWIDRGDANTILTPEMDQMGFNPACSLSGDGVQGDSLVMAETVTRRVPLGAHRLPDHTRMHKHGRFDYRFEKRRADIPVWAEFTGPSLDAMWNDVVECTRIAVTIAIIVAVASENPAAGYQQFYPTWLGCMRSKVGRRANQIQVALGHDSVATGSWTGH